MRAAPKLLLLILGVPLCYVLTSGISWILERGAERLESLAIFLITPRVFGVLLMLVFIALYAAYAWLVLRRWDEPESGFEVLPPKE